MSEPETRQFYVEFTTGTHAASVSDAIQIGLAQLELGSVHVRVTTDTPGEVIEFDTLPDLPLDDGRALALDATDHSKRAQKLLSDRVKLIAPGFYIERDGGDWYCVAPGEHGRVGADFSRPTNALRLILWLAGDPLPAGWEIKSRRGSISADIECGQGYHACLWRREAAKLFPARIAELAA